MFHDTEELDLDEESFQFSVFSTENLENSWSVFCNFNLICGLCKIWLILGSYSLVLSYRMGSAKCMISDKSIGKISCFF